MPNLIKNFGARQHHPLYRSKNRGDSMERKRRSESPEKTVRMQKTNDAIKTAAAGEMKAKGKT
jgi:hypothetical protein